MTIDVNDDHADSTIFGADEMEKYFPGCVIRREDGGFTLDHGRLTDRYIMGIKATTSLDLSEFIAIMIRAWEGCEVVSTPAENQYQ